MRCVTQCSLIERYQTTPCHNTKDCNNAFPHKTSNVGKGRRKGGRKGGRRGGRESNGVIFKTGCFISVTQFPAFIVSKNPSAVTDIII